jgi:large subunit ribosomal protein L21
MNSNKEQAKEFAIVRTGGKQYVVSPQTRIRVEKIEAQVGDEIVLAEVLFYQGSGGEKDVKIGAPLLDGASVKGRVIGQDRDKKVLIFKKRKRKGYTKKQGHRQYKTEILISEIVA